MYDYTDYNDEYFKKRKNEYNFSDNSNNNSTELFDENINEWKSDSFYGTNDNFNFSDSERMCNDFLRKNSDESLMKYYPYNNNPYDNHCDLNNSMKKIYPNSKIDNDLISTNENSEHLYTEKKTNPENIQENKSETENKNIIDNNNNTEIISGGGNKGKKERGRIKIKPAGGEKHTKLDEDNIMRKLKTKFFKFIRDDLNKSFKYTKYKFLPLTPKINVSLEKETNVKLFNRTIEDIFGNTELNKTYN